MAVISRATTWTDGQVLTAAALNGEFNNILNDYNGNITNANISASAAIDTSKINATFPSGAIVGTTDTQVLTNKDLSSATNTFPANLGGTDGWVTSSDTWVYASASTFTIASVDRTSIYTKGTRLRFKQGGGYKYAVVINSSFASDTTVTIAVNTDYTIANAVITNNYYSYQESPQGYPTWFNYSANTTWNGTPPSTATTVAQFSVVGQMCFYRYYQTNTVAGSSNTVATIAQPIASNVSSSIYHDGGTGYVSTAETISAPNQIPNPAPYVTLFSNTIINADFISLSAKSLWLQGFYAF